MNKLEALEKSVKEIRRIKKLRGYQYGKSDCWKLFTTYDSKVNKLNNLDNKINEYKTHTIFHRKVKELGYKNLIDMLMSNGYKKVNNNEFEIGDICLFNSPTVDVTISVYDGEYWINSSDFDKYEKLPNKFVLPRLVFAGRLEKTYEKI